MKLDISPTISLYETIAIATAVLIPFLQFIYRKFFCSPKLNYFANKNMWLYFNYSGPQICISGVYEVKGKPVIIRNISLKLLNGKSEVLSEMAWDATISPVLETNVTHNTGNSSVHITEMPHPFKVQTDDVTCANLIFKDEQISKKLSKVFLELQELAHEIKQHSHTADYESAYSLYTQNAKYLDAKTYIESIFLWKTGIYDIEITTTYQQKEFVCKYRFQIKDEDKQPLFENIQHVLDYSLLITYGKPIHNPNIVITSNQFVRKFTHSKARQ